MSKYCYKCEKDVELVKDPASNAQLCIHCRTIIIHSASKLPPGTILSGFQIVEEIGRGGMGIVYRAKQLNLERHVALKVLADDLARDDEFVENFFKEARAAASLNHPNIVQVFDAGSTPEGIYYFAMELIVGETLETRIQRDGCLAAKEAMRIAIKIVDALDYAWESQKLTHGDIKPDNIILNSSGGAKLADLGLAKFMHDESSAAGIMATPLYAPPEIIKGETEKIGSQSDMYSFGATLFQMLTGVPPFADDIPDVVFKHHLKDPPPLISNFNPHFAPTLIQLVNQLLEKDPRERPFSWADISKAMKKIREPEIEGKVFHTHHAGEHDTSSTTAEGTEEPTKSMKPVIGLLIAVVTGLLIAITVIVIGDKNVKDINPDDPLPAGSSAQNTEAAKKELDVIKSQLKFFSPEQSVTQLEKLINKYGKNSPAEAVVLLDKYKNQVLNQVKKAEQQEKEITNFNNSLAQLLEDINGTAITDENTPIKTVQSLAKRIETTLQQSSSKSYLKISNTDRTALNTAYMTLSSRLIKFNQEQERIALLKEAEEKQKKFEERKRIKEELEKKHQEAMAINKTIDNYFLILADYSKNKKIEDLTVGLTEWSTKSTSIPATYSMRVNFLKKQAIPNIDKFIDHIIKHEDSLKGQTLPLSVCPVKYRKYKVKEVNEAGIKLILADGKVALGYTLKWSKMPPKALAVIIKDRLLVNADGKKELNEEESLAVISYVLLKAPKHCEEIIDLLTGINDNDKRMWGFLATDMAIAEDESKLIDQYAKFCKAYEEKDFFKASEILVGLSSDAKLTVFGKRYAEELQKSEQVLMSINPAIQANQLLAQCNSEKTAQNPNQLFNMCMVAEARYTNLLDQESAAKLKELKEKSLQSLVEKSGVKTINANRIPFYYWSMEKTGISWAYYDVVAKSGKMAGQPKVLASMQLAAALDNGDWALAKKIMDAGEALDIPGLENMKRTYNWASSFIFARGVLELQYDNGDKRQEALTALLRIAQNNTNPAMKPITTALAMEYCLMAKQSNRAIDLGQQYQYSLGPLAKIEARVALLHILALIEKDSSKPGEINQAVNQFNKSFRNIPDMQHGDNQWCSLALNLINSNFDPQKLKTLRLAKCDFPDVSARILLSSWARFYSTQNTRLSDQQEKELLGLIKSQITSIFVANESWKRLTIFKLALSGNPGTMRTEATQAMSDFRICSTGFYPSLVLIKGGAEYADNRFSVEETKTNLQRFLEASVVKSPNDLKILEIISSGDPSSLVSKFFVTNLSDKGYLSAIVGLMVHYKKPNVRSSIVRVLNENYNLLTWEERYLVKQLQTWQ